jgi:hypothetical protein
LPSHFPQAAGEHLAQALFQTHRGEIGKRLSRNGKDFLLCPPADCLVQVPLFVSQRFLPF